MPDAELERLEQNIALERLAAVAKTGSAVSRPESESNFL
jgi:hypothetical protein